MLKPLLIVAPGITELTDRPSQVGDYFLDHGFHPLMSGYNVASITQGKDKVDYILVVLPDDLSDDVKQALFFLRDMCIDEEKNLYVCGNKTSLMLVKLIIPAMLINGSYEIRNGELGYVAGQMKKNLSSDGEKAGCLIIDDDLEYCRMFRLALREYCDVAFSDGSLAQTTPYIGSVRLLILSMDLKMDMLDWTKMRALIAKNKKRPEFRVIMIAKNNKRQQEVIRILNDQGVCLSKEIDFLKNAAYLKKLFFS